MGVYDPYFLTSQVYDKLYTLKIYIKDVEFVFDVRYNDKMSDYVLDKRLLIMYLEELIKLFYEVDGVERRRRVNIDYYPHKNRKKLPLKKNLTIGVEHVNSGYCYVNSGEQDTNIVIFRTEEFFKVLVHELIHLYKIVPNDNDFDNHINLKYKLNNYILTNESLVEINALIYNCIIIHKLTGKDLNNLISKEYRWSSNVLSNILKYYGSLNNWKENSNVFAYYYLKTLLLAFVMRKTKISQLYINNSFRKNNSLKMTINDVNIFKIT